MTSARWRILIVDDHEVVRLGLRSLLERYPNLRVVGEAGDVGEALQQVERHRPDVVLLDIRLPGRSGLEACRQICSLYPDTRVIMLTSYEEEELLFEAIAAGASGYLLKRVGSEELVHAIETVCRGEALLDPAVTDMVFARVRELEQERRRQAFAGLTDQELRVLALVSQGLSNKTIAQEVGLREKTVRNYVSSILSKLGFSSRVQAATYALKNHIEEFLS